MGVGSKVNMCKRVGLAKPGLRPYVTQTMCAILALILKKIKAP